MFLLFLSQCKVEYLGVTFVTAFRHHRIVGH
nr:MAG TPA: hypothetical protein [Crassvirales sp.]